MDIVQKAREPFARGCPSQQDGPVLCGDQIAGQAVLAGLGKFGFPTRKLFEARSIEPAKRGPADCLGGAMMVPPSAQANEFARKMKRDDLTTPVREQCVKLDNPARQAEYAVRPVSLMEQGFSLRQADLAPLIAQLGERLHIKRVADSPGADRATATRVLIAEIGSSALCHGARSRLLLDLFAGHHCPIQHGA
jgi:hypothetical protein